MGIEKEQSQFAQAAIKHGEATENGDHKEANKQYKKIQSSVIYLLKDVNSFSSYLSHENPYVRLWAGSYLIKVEEVASNAKLTLEKLQLESGFLGFNAQMVLQQSNYK